MTTGVQSILNKEGSIDILINNAGYGSYGAVEDVPVDEARRQFEVNIFGLAWLTQLVLPSHVRGGMKDTTNFVDMTPSLIKQNAHNTEFAEKLYRLSLEGK